MRDRDADSYYLMLLERYRQECFSAGVAHCAGNMKDEERYLCSASKTREELEQEFRNR